MLKSIYARTFLLMLGAILFTQLVVLLIPEPRPDISVSVRLTDIARALREEQVPGPPPLGGDEGPPQHREPGPPPDGPFGGRLPPDAPQSLAAESIDAKPSPGALVDAGPARDELAHMLDLAPLDVFLYVDARDIPKNAASARRLSLTHGFAAGARIGGRWRQVSRSGSGLFSTTRIRTLEIIALELLVLMPLAWVFARALSAPTRRFADAARRVGQDSGAAPLPREGPQEMLAAVDAFNAMQARLNHLMQERTRMVAAIAHDLRTPLTRLAFRLDDLPAPLGDKVRADIEEMKSMISAALDFMRERHFAGPRERVDMRLLVERIVNDQADLGHAVTFQETESVVVEAAPLALRRLVGNLIDNALKYGERARLKLSRADGLCLLEIDDDGPGIPESLHQQVFEPFFRVEGSRNRDTGGIGLGLAAVRAIVLEHGGEVALANRKAGGLRVSVTLPAVNGG
ncbi:MAG TPA: ATP-binding protein [Steroidobacteraceae bacterium]